MNTGLKNEVETLFRGLVGQMAWGAKVGWGSFVTVEFGPKRLQNHHYHGDWHLWLYQCDWSLKSATHEMANSESKRGVMQTAIDNLNGREFLKISFDRQHMVTRFVFRGDLCLACQPYGDSEPNEEAWMLFMPNKQVASLVPRGLKCEPARLNGERTVSPR